MADRISFVEQYLCPQSKTTAILMRFGWEVFQRDMLSLTHGDAAWERAKQYLPARSSAVQINGATHNVHRSTFNAFMQVVNDFLSQDRKDTNE